MTGPGVGPAPQTAPEPRVPEGWCDKDDYFASGRPRPENEEIPVHKHVSRTKVQFLDGKTIGTLVGADDKGGS